MIDVTDATLEAEIVVRSDTVPVVVDLWAPWCGPCKTLGPIIEKVVDGTDGKVVLAKINVDENPGASQMFKVQSIPAVFAVKDRRVVGSFIGAVPEAQVQQFVDDLLPTEQESEVDRLLGLGDEASLRAALELEPANATVVTALAELLSVERGEEALELLVKIPETSETRRIAAVARTGGDVAIDDADEQLEGLLPRVKADEDARQQFVDLLEVLGPDDPRTAEWRKRLTLALY